MQLVTPRLVLRPATFDEIAASLSPAFAKVAGPVVHDWPPRYWDAPAVEWLKEELARPHEVGWYVWLIRLGGVVIGTVGVTGPPTDGSVEIGYGIVDSHWRRGFATEAVAALCAWILADPRVKLICATTLLGDPASAGVLLKNTFILAGRVENHRGEASVDRFERRA